MQKSHLFTPGPTMVPPDTMLEMARPIIHHRTAAFASLFRETLDLLKWIFQTGQPVMVLSSSGTGGMEAAIVNTLKRGDTIITVNGGKFGERWGKIGKAYGLSVVEIMVEWGQAVDVDTVRRTLAEHPQARAVCWQACETSTGVVHPTEALAALCREAGPLSIVDGITAVGAFNVPMDAWGIDILVGGSQKAFMLPPGMAMIALSERAWESYRTSDLPRFYFDLARERKNNDEQNFSAWTPPVTLIQGLRHNLRRMQGEGLDALFHRHETLARAVRAGARGMGLDVFAKAPSPSITAISVPEGVDGKKLKKSMDQRGVHLAGGQDQLTGRIVRIGHMGYYDAHDMLMALAALEQALAAAGHAVSLGAGVKAASEVFLAGG